MTKFLIGDRVRCISDYGEGAIPGDTGTVVDGDGWCVFVEWDEYRACRHDCGNRCKPHHGWNIPEDNVELIREVMDLGEIPTSDLSLIL